MYAQHADLRCTVIVRSNSAHDLGEDIDPEMLPDLEALQESFEIPAQLRMDLLTPGEAPQQQSDLSRDSTYGQHHSQHHGQQHSHLQHQSKPGADSFHKDATLYGHKHLLAHASGATTPSGPRSSASDESLHPSGHYSHGGRPQQVAAQPLLEEATDLSPTHLAQSKSLPLLDGFEGLAELQQQAANMLADVSEEQLVLLAMKSVNLKHCINNFTQENICMLANQDCITSCLPPGICLNTHCSSLLLHRSRHSVY